MPHSSSSSPSPVPASPALHVLRIDALDGDQTTIALSAVLDEDATLEPVRALYAVASPDEDGVLEIVDNGYRTLDEVFAAYPALRPASARRDPTTGESSAPEAGPSERPHRVVCHRTAGSMFGASETVLQEEGDVATFATLEEAEARARALNETRHTAQVFYSAR